MAEQVSLFAPDTWSGKTSREHLAPTRAKISQQSSKKRSVSSARKPPLCLCLKKDGLNLDASTMTWEDGALLGEFTTRSFGESPSEENASLLPQILEDSPHPKYFLSEKACLGILTRAERRGKELPPELKAALLVQSRSKSEAENLGGKGILIQEERTGALSTLNNQSVLQLEPTPINTMVATRHNALGEGTGFGVGKPGDPAYTVSAAHSHAVLCLQGNMIDRDVKMNGIGVSEEPMYSLNTVDRHGVLCLNDQGGSVMGVSEDVVGSLRAQEHGHQPTVYDARGNGDGSIACTITGDHQNRVTDYTAIITGFAQQGFGDYKAGEVASSLKRRDFKDATTLAVDVRNLNETEELSGTLQSKNNGGYSLNYQNPVRMGNCVRRLTPLECERLQGYPDKWTDIGEWVDSKGKKHKESSDSARYKALGNSIALPFWFYLLRRISAQYERPATLGSLFDGIGGFPLCWERCNGKGTALWASEIEEFPIAVTKVRFPET